MYCEFAAHPDTPGRFICKRCKIPSSRNKSYGPEGPPPRHCPTLPEPRDPEDVAYILGTLCPGCSHYHADQICHCGNCSKGVPIARLIEFGHCPAYRW